MDALAKGVVEIEIDDNKVRVQLDKTEREIRRAGDEASRAFKAGFERNKFDVGEAIAGKSGAATNGILALSQAADDLQYGFRGIVNNIPSLVTGLGAGAGVAGAAQIAAVAINQLINNWDRLAASFAGGLPDPKIAGQTPEAASVQLAAMDEEIRAMLLKKGQGGPRGTSGLDAFEEKRLKKLQAASKDAHERLGAAKAVEAHGDLATNAAKKSAAAFSNALANLPFGSETLMRKLGETMREGDAEVLIAQALRGERGAMAEIMGKLPAGKDWDKFRGRAMDPDKDARRKRLDAKLEKDTNEGVRQLEQEEAAKEAEDRKAVEARFRARADEVVNRRTVLEAKRDILQEKADGTRQSQTFSGAKSYLGSVQSSAMNQLPRQQLEAVKATNELIKKSNTELEGIRKQREEALARFSK